MIVLYELNPRYHIRYQLIHVVYFTHIIFSIAYPLFVLYSNIRINYLVSLVNLLLNIVTTVVVLILAHYLLHDTYSNASHIISVPLIFPSVPVRVYIDISLIDDTLVKNLLYVIAANVAYLIIFSLIIFN